MPASGYELGMGQFLLPGLGGFLFGWGVVLLAGWLLERRDRRAAARRSGASGVQRKQWDGEG